MIRATRRAAGGDIPVTPFGDGPAELSIMEFS